MLMLDSSCSRSFHVRNKCARYLYMDERAEIKYTYNRNNKREEEKKNIRRRHRHQNIVLTQSMYVAAYSNYNEL